MIIINFDLYEIILLTFFFTILAIYLEVHSKKHVSLFITNHISALFFSLVISKIIYNLSI